MNKIIVCDLDGTLANCEHRQHYVQNGKKNWPAFFREMSKDEVVEDLNDVLLLLHQHYDIYFVSARPDDYREVTQKWLEDAGWIINGEDVHLIMRKAGDYRADTIVKQEIFNLITVDNKIVMAFDDRKSVVDMWRANGVLCAQIQDHDF